jgi:hypothetical protein
MAGDVGDPSPVAVGSTDSLYRGINPRYYQPDGTLTSGVFVLKKKHKVEEGPSVGIAKLIPLNEFRSRIDEGWGVGEFEVSVVEGLGLRVQPLPAPKWGEYANAHGVITDYQVLTDSKKTDAERALKNALQKRILIPPTERPESPPFQSP